MARRISANKRYKNVDNCVMEWKCTSSMSRSRSIGAISWDHKNIFCNFLLVIQPQGSPSETLYAVLILQI